MNRELIERMEHLSVRVLAAQLRTLRLFGEPAALLEPTTVLAWRQGLGMPAFYERWVQESLCVLARAGYLAAEGKSWRMLPALELDAAQVFVEWESFIAEAQNDAALGAQIRLLDATLRALPDILRGTTPATSILFQDSSISRVEGIYKDSPQVDHFNGVLVERLAAYLDARLAREPDARFRLLEIGAGTGGTSGHVFEKLRSHAASIAEYCYTDLSRAFLLHAEETFGPTTPYLTYRILNVEQPLAAQGFEPGTFDVVIAANVLHATASIRKAVRNTKAALKRHGLLLLNEINSFNLATHLTFGLLKGWWLYEDAHLRVPGTPALSAETWRRVLASEGFESIGFPAESAHAVGQQIVVAESDGLIRQPRSGLPAPKPALRIVERTPAPATPVSRSEPPRRVARGSAAVPAVAPRTDVTIQLADARQGVREIVCELLELNRAQVRDDATFVEFGVDSVRAVALIRRVNERFGVALPTTAIFDHHTVERLSKHVARQARTPKALTPQATLPVPDIVAETTAQPIATRGPDDGTKCRRVLIHGPGSIDEITVAEGSVPQPADHQVRIAVEACALNFSDLLCVRGLYPVMPPYPFTPGSEVSGIVLDVGPAVRSVKPGDAVVAITAPDFGGHATCVLAHEALVFRKPDSLSFEEVCALPMVGFTMIDAFRRARVQRGERILIQTAAGGTGLIAVQLARHHGAEIFATAGSQAKLDYLASLGVQHLINYREQDFETEIARLTGGAGVDVIINTLPGDAMQKGLRSLAPGGRYIEIAMTALMSARSVDLSVLDNNQEFFAVNLARLLGRRPELLAEYWLELTKLLEQGAITPTISEVLPFEKLQDAYRRLDDRQNIGKVVMRTSASLQRVPVAANDAIAREPIAIIGASARLPKSANLGELWTHLANGDDLTQEVTRWDLSRYASAEPCPRGGFLEHIDHFDPLFFSISGTEANYMDPQQRLFLEESWKALEDAGYVGSRVSELRCGVYAGCTPGDYTTLFTGGPPQAMWGNADSVVPARISYYLNLHGPAITVDTACSSSLVAMHLACQGLWQKETDLALAGGVHLQCTPRFFVVGANASMLSPKGRCHVFDDRADGFTPGEGVVVMVLKRLADALRDGDHIEGVIRGSGINQDGATNGITAPSAESQERLEREVYEGCGIRADDIQVVEAHGTGTKLGDPIEWRALSSAFARDTDRKQFCAIGSVKSNLGHTAAAAGATGVVKLLLALKHRQIPPSLHFEHGNPHIDFDGSAFYVNTRLRDWDVAPGKKRRAAVSSFGFSGTNAHMVIEEAPTMRRVHAERPAYLVALSARSAGQRRQQVEQLLAFCEANPQTDCGNLSHTLLLGREHFNYRFAVVAGSLDELAGRLRQWLSGGAAPAFCGDLGDTDLRKQGALADFGNRSITECARVPANDEYRQRLASVAELHVQGYELAFEGLFADGGYGRISLPAYPFAREHHWVPAPVAVSAPAATLSTLHPLVHVNTSSLAEQRFSSTFTGSEFFLADHQVQGKKILTGVACLEMARAAVLLALRETVTPETRVELSRMVWMRPIVGDEPVTVHTRLKPQDGGAIEVEIYSQGAEQELLHARGYATLSRPAQPAPADLRNLERRCDRRLITAADIYGACDRIGVAYGPSFRCVESVNAGDGEALARLQLPAAAPSADYVLHPSLLDGAMQASIGALLDADGAMPGEPALLFALDSLTTFAPLGPRVWAWIRRAAGEDSAIRKLDIDLCNEQGEVCVRAAGVASRAFAGAGAAPRPATGTGALTFVPQWQATLPPKGSNGWPQAQDPVLVINGTSDQRRVLGEHFPQVHAIDIGAADDVDGIAAKLADAAHIFWFAPESVAQAPGDEALIDCQRAGLTGALRLLSALLQRGYGERPLGLTMLTQQSQAVRDESHDPSHAGVHGFAGTLAKEYPAWQVRVVDLSHGPELPLAQILRLPPDPHGNAWAHRGEWYRQRLTAYEPRSGMPTRFRDGGVYVIVGGAGSIGTAFSEYLIRRYRAQVVWLGRRPLTAEIQANIDRLGASGPAPVYLVCDATDRAALEAAHSRIREMHPRIHGLVHSSLALLGSDLAHLDESRFEAGLRAKVDVSVRMAQVFGGEDLDFVLFFSSIQSFEKTPRQAGYASGCNFTDAFAGYLAREWSCDVRVMNWGYWSSLGMVASIGSFQNWLAQAGFAAIDPERAMGAIESLLTSPYSQHVYLQVAAPQALKYLDPLPETLIHAPVVLPDLRDAMTKKWSEAVASTAAPATPGTRELERALCRLLLAQLRSLGLPTGSPTADEVETWMAGAGILPLYQRWMHESMRVLREQDLLGASAADTADVWQEWERSVAQWIGTSDLKAQATLLEAALRELPRILTGAVPPTDVLFPRASLTLVGDVYKGNRVANPLNESLAATALAFVEARRAADPAARLRILEIGAGTGGTTEEVLARLAPHRDAIAEYCYTDLSRSFLLHAQKHYVPGHPFVKPAIFNVERPPGTQQFDVGAYDIVIAGNVLHATTNIRTTLRHTRSLLKANGLLLLNELTGHALVTHLTFGLLEGWWRFEDDAVRLPGCPGVAVAMWQRLLAEEGFHSSFLPLHQQGLNQQIIAAFAGDQLRLPLAAEASAPAAAPVAAPTPTMPKATSRAVAIGEDVVRDQATAAIISQLATGLQIDASRIDPDKAFADYGLDSIMGVGAAEAINKALSIELTTTSLFEYPTVNKLAAHVCAEYGEVLAARLRIAVPEESPATSPAVEVTPPVRNDLRSDSRFAARPAPANAPDPMREPIAIIGMAGQYAQSDDLEELWRALSSGTDLTEPVSRWDLASQYAAAGIENGCPRGGFVRNIDQFDPLFFNISGLEAAYMDPQQRLFLQEAWKALEDGGYAGAAIEGRRCGCYVGLNAADFQRVIELGTPPPQAAWGSAASIVSARIAYFLDLKGPAITIDTACSSSLVAIHLACQALRAGETELALAGGVFIQSTPVFYLGSSRGGMLSPTGRCHTFDDRADGFVPGEGVAVLLLKRLSAALADGDHVHAVIRGSGINQDGTTNGITAPNALSQEALIGEVYERFDIHPDSIQMIEAHGTGTKLGDPIEFRALTKAFRKKTGKENFCAVGSIKTNIGHTTSASGVAGVIKAVLSMQHRQIPPSLNFESGNSHIEFGGSPFYVNTALRDWAAGAPRRAAVSSFGLSGTNAHLVLEEAPVVQRHIAARPVYLVVLSARSSEQLTTQAAQLIARCEQSAIECLDLSFTLTAGRRHFNHRLACVVANREELVQMLRAWCDTARTTSRLFIGAPQGLAREQGALKRLGDRAIRECLEANNAGDYGERLAAIAELYVQGYELDFAPLFAGSDCRRIPLPSYPFARERYWVDLPDEIPEPRRAPAQAAPAEVARSSAPARAGTEAMMVAPCWEAAPLAQAQAWPAPESAVLLVGGDEHQRPSWMREFPRATVLDATGDVESIAGKLRAIGWIDHVVWIAPHAALPDSAAPESFIADQDRGVIALYRLVKALLKLDYGQRALGWTMLTWQSQAAGATPPDPTHAGVLGFAGSMAKEYENWRVRVVDLPLETGAGVLAAELQSALVRIPADAQGDAWALRGGEWYRQQLVACDFDFPATNPYRNGGVYVIVGGAGGLGEVFSEELIRAAKAQVVWIGRQPLNERITASIERLAKLGPAPCYLRADARDHGELTLAVNTVKQRFGAIHGLVHAALVLRDKSLSQMDEEQFIDSLRAKVDVSVRLAQVFAGEPLDFVLFFSSLQSRSKSAGQSNYAAGSTFKDAFAHALAAHWTCAVRIMNWGFWGGIGSVATDSYRARMAAQGVESIEPAEGMHAVRTLLQSPLRQLALFKSVHAGKQNARELMTSVGAAIAGPIEPAGRVSSREFVAAAAGDAGREYEAATPLLLQILLSQLQSLGFFSPGNGSPERCAQRIGMPATLHRWLAESVRLLTRDGYLRATGEKHVADTLDADALWSQWQATARRFASDPNLAAQVRLLDNTLQALPQILRGKKSPTEVLFSNASMERVEGVYRGNENADYFNLVLTDTLLEFVTRQRAAGARGLRILEIGAGTGGTSAGVFEALKGHEDLIAEYCYTDISRAFLLHAEQAFAPTTPYLSPRLFDVERTPQSQGIDLGAYDVVIATNVLHATRNIRNTLRNTKAVLKRNGLLLVNELTRHSVFAHLTFGLLPGWWLHEDTALRITGSPGVSEENWRKVLVEEGFESVSFPAEVARERGQQVIVARSDGLIRKVQDAKAVAHATPARAPKAARPARESRTGGAAPERLRDRVILALKEIVGEALRISPQQLEAQEPLERYGIDSLIVIGLTNKLREIFPSLSNAFFLEYRTIAACADQLLATERDTVREWVGAQTAQGAPAASDDSPEPIIESAVAPAANDDAPLLVNDHTRGDIAIIGLSGRYPQSANVGEFWENVKAGKDCITEVPADRWDLTPHFSPVKGTPGKTSCKWGGFIDDIDRFDHEFFDVPLDAAAEFDPLERVFMQVAWHLLEDAGYTRRRMRERHRSEVGVYVGAAPYVPSGSSPRLIACRTAQFLSLCGPTMVVDTFSASSTTALHLACEALQRGECQMALVGGAAIMSPELMIACSSMLNSRPEHRGFSTGDGMILAEGVGAVLLKPLAAAQRDHDRILSVIKATAMNNAGGFSEKIVRDPRTVSDVIRSALKRAGVPSRSVGYIEMAAIGDQSSDFSEFTACMNVFKDGSPDRDYCAVGTVKSNVGHAMAVSGLTQLTKAVLQLRHGVLAPTIKADPLAPLLNLTNGPFHIQRTLEPWQTHPDGSGVATPRRALLTSFGGGGTNMCLVLEEPPPQVRATPEAPARDLLFFLSAHTAEALRKVSRNILERVITDADLDLGNLSHTLMWRREPLSHRLAIIARTRDELMANLRAFLETDAAQTAGETRLRSFTGEIRDGHSAVRELLDETQERRLLEEYLHAYDLERLATFWVRGSDVQVLDGHPSSAGELVELPLYPFAGERLNPPPRVMLQT